MAGPRDLKLEHQLCFAIYSAAHAFNRFYKPLLGKLGLTYPQYLVLLVLWEQDGIGVSTIGERLLLDSGTLTPLLKRMETMGLVTRERLASDERQVSVKLTARGRRLKATAEGFPAQVLAASDCSASELNAMRRAMLGLRESLDEAA